MMKERPAPSDLARVRMILVSHVVDTECSQPQNCGFFVASILLDFESCSTVAGWLNIVAALGVRQEWRLA